MTTAAQIPPEVWCELALRLESCGVSVTEQQARLAAAAALSAWPGAYTKSEDWYSPADTTLILPLAAPSGAISQEARDEHAEVLEDLRHAALQEARDE